MVFLWPFVSTAQKIKPVTIGDKVPDITLNQVLNYTAASATLGHLSDRLLILDFMHTACPSCLENLERYISLEKSFHGNIRFAIVTSQKRKEVESFLRKSPIGKRIDFPVIVQDSTLSALFPHKYISHIVWIGKDRIVKAITDGEYVTADNLLWIINGNKNKWPVKKDVPDFDYEKPFMVLNQQIQDIQTFPILSSTFIPYLPGVGQYFIVQKDTINKTIRTAFINQPLPEMCVRLFGLFHFPHSQILLNVKDRDNYVFDNGKFIRTDWDLKHTFCYESILPSSISDKRRQEKILNDLNFYFNVKASFNERDLSCMILRQTNTNAGPLSNRHDSLTIEDIIYLMNEHYSEMPVFNSDPKTDKTWISITKQQVNNIDVLKKILLQYGFEFTLEPRKVEVLDISEPSFFTKQKN